MFKQIKYVVLFSLTCSILPMQGMSSRFLGQLASRLAAASIVRPLSHSLTQSAKCMPTLAIATKTLPSFRPGRFTSSIPQINQVACVNQNVSNVIHALQDQRKNQDKDQKQKRYFNPYLAMALGALGTIATASVAHCEDKEEQESVKLYELPFEQARNQCSEDLGKTLWGEVAKERIERLKKEEQSLMDELFKNTRITPAEWSRYEEDCCGIVERGELKSRECKDEENMSEQDLLVWKKRVSSIQKLLMDCNISPDEIKIVPEENDGSPMVAHSANKTIFIDPVMMHTDFNIAHSFEAAACHEIQHLLHDDTIKKVILLALLETHNIDRVYGELFSNRLSRFQEKRADILAGLLDPKYAKSLSDMFSQRDQRNKSEFVAKLSWLQWTLYQTGVSRIPSRKSDNTHPLDSERAQYLKKLHQEMVAAIEKNKSKK
ncbi:MAG: hypothetical protein NTX86_06425 [Candidatus Dependentiae bacterium]|nr:hypothetical protein [Candidatus Dependentiae bacterium]